MYIQKILFPLALITTLCLSACSDKDNDNYTQSNDYEDQNNNSSNSTEKDDSSRYDFEYRLGIRLNSSFYSESTDTYIYDIFIGWGVPEGVYNRDIIQFGLEAKVSIGDISYMTPDDVYTSKNGAWTYIYGFIYDNSAHNWGTTIFIESKYANISLNYRTKFYDRRTNEYIISSTQEETFNVNQY